VKTIEKFLSYLRSLDVKLWADGDRLRYSAPKGTLTPTSLAELAGRKAEILTFLHKAEHASYSSTIPPIRPVPRNGDLPLSFAQQRLWFLDQLEDQSATYNMPAALHLIGSLHVDALEQSLMEIVRRHEILRTTFPMLNGYPVQVIAPTLTLTLLVVDLQALPEVEQSAEVRRLATEEAQRPFDLANGSLLRVTLLKLGQEEHMLLLTMHHIVYDGWSIGIFIRELVILYEAFSKGAPSPLPELPIQYADFAHWQRQWLQGEVLETQLNYWKQQLAAAPPLLELPTDRPRPPVETFRGSTEPFQLNPDLTRKLKTLSQRSGTTLFMTLMAAFVTLLSRYSGQEDIVVGSPIANRNRSETESLIGFFVNTLVLRTHLQGNPTFQDLLARVRQVALDAYAHQDLPFEQLVEALQPERSLSHTPLFQVMFVLQNAPMERLELPGLTLASLEMEIVTAQFDMTLSIEEIEQGLNGELEYNMDLFDGVTITRMVRHFQRLLEAIVANPEQRVSELPLLTEAERHQLLVEWNNTQAEYPQDKCIHQLFEAQVEQTPDAVAVVFEDQQLTYRELNVRANRLSRLLVEQGVSPDTTVALLAERSIDFLSAMMAVFKAGGAYLPLDSNYPANRLYQVLEQSQTPLVLAASKFEPVLSQVLVSLPSGKRPQVLLIEELLQQQRSEENLPVCCTPSHLAYVIYTSGSTGAPKGAMLEHRGMLNHLYAKILELKLTDADTVAQTARQSFDISVWQFLAALLVGGRVHIFNDEVARDPAQLLEQMERQGISLLEIVPSLLRMMVEQIGLSGANRPKLSKLRWLLLTGETLPPLLCRQWLNYYPAIPMLNAYGPTECSDDVTHYPIYQPPAAEVLNIPIGRPVANMRLYVLDSQLQPVPIGVAGELYVGGIGVGRGYLNNAERTAEVFIADPFAQEPGARLYKTGDLARYLSDGNIEFLGRLDHQVKIRGFRIELGEIEAVLAQHPEVLQTVVVAWEDHPSNKCLVAYMVPNQEQGATPSELRRFLKEKLPDYMVPSAFVMLNSLPLTPNGKVDRHALPAPDTSRLRLEASFIPPRDTLELQLAQIWENVLDVHPVGVRDNFFDQGGHSLLAVRLMAQIQQQFGKNLPLVTLFQDATIEHLAGLLRQQTDSLSWSPLVAIQPAGNRPPFFCIHPVGGNVLCYVDLARHLGCNQPFYGLQSPGLHGGEQEPLTRIEDMTSHYIEALQTIQPQGPYHLGGWSLGGIVAFEMAQQLYQQGHEVALLALIDTEAPMVINMPEEIDEAMLVASLARDMGGLFAKHLPGAVDELQQLEPDEQLNHILDQAKMVNILPPEVGSQQVRQLLQVFKANLQAISRYMPQRYPGRITLFCASEQVMEVTQAPGWAKLAAGGVETHKIPGDHYAIVQEPHVQILAERLRACLNQAHDEAQTRDLEKLSSHNL
jgi:amino acid adenylation domain-containing protein